MSSTPFESQSKSRFYLGIDGGQSSTTALIADHQGRVLGYGRGGPCNHVSGPEAQDKFISVIASCIGEASKQAGLDFPRLEFASACLGLSGGFEDKEELSRKLIRSRRLKLTHDAEIALAGATGGQPGIVVIAGTGSMAFGRNAEGKTARAGGWGYIVGDEGGGFDIVKRAIRAALQSEEGWGTQTELVGALLTATRNKTANELLHRIYSGHSRQFIASLAPLVSEAAEHGDLVARGILQSAATSLAWYATGVYQQLFQRPTEVPVAYAGNVFRSEPLRASFRIIVGDSLSCPVAPPIYAPVAGSLIEALRLDDNSALPNGLPEDLN